VPRKPPPRCPKGTRFGKGRQKGVPNKISVEARTLASQLVSDVVYQARLRRDFRIRRVHPTIESLIWAYHLGKPAQPVTVSGSMALDINAKLEEERRVFAALDLTDLEQLAAESQRLVDRAYALSRIAQGTPPVVVGDIGDSAPSESLAIPSRSDKDRYVNLQTPDDETPETP
jgi:hypothetical protein